jgi:hypothetical protein
MHVPSPFITLSSTLVTPCITPFDLGPLGRSSHISVWTLGDEREGTSMKRSQLFAVGFVLSSVFTFGATAYAKWYRLAGSTCESVWGSNTTDGDGSVVSASQGALSCPIPENDSFDRTQVKTLNVYLHTNSADAGAAAACRNSFDGDTYQCGAAKLNNAGAGEATLTPDLWAWQNSLGYVHVVVYTDKGTKLHGLFLGDK